MSETPAYYRLSPEAAGTEPAGFWIAAALTARAENAEARVKDLLTELAEQEVAKLALVKENQEQKAMIGALDLIRAGYMEKCSQITNLLLTFPEYDQAEKYLLAAARLNAAQ